jgi:hypothetical protein
MHFKEETGLANNNSYSWGAEPSSQCGEGSPSPQRSVAIITHPSRRTHGPWP